MKKIYKTPVMEMADVAVNGPVCVLTASDCRISDGGSAKEHNITEADVNANGNWDLW